MTPAAVRLPAGWTAGTDDEGHPVAGPVRREIGDPLLVHRSVDATGVGLAATADSLVAELRSTRDELLVLDTGVAHLPRIGAGGPVAHRLAGGGARDHRRALAGRG